MVKARYTFGTTGSAAKRLESIAAFFDPLSEVLIGTYVKEAASALDLGCGPGCTTAMLARALPRAQIAGLDKSPEFLRRARRRLPRGEFLAHDVTVTPFPRRAEVLYARSLLSHLPEPAALVNRWLGELPPGGWLIVEELEEIETGVGAFRQYLEVNAALIAAQGAELFVGGALGRGRYDAAILLNKWARLPVPNRQAAAWFLPNVETVWETDPFVRARLDPAARAALRAELKRLARAGDENCDITWYMRRLVLRKAP